MKTRLCSAILAAVFSTIAMAAPQIVTQNNYAQAYTNMRFAAIQWNILMRHYGPSKNVMADKPGYNVTDMVRQVK